MRFIDLAVAALIGTSSIAGILAMSPGVGDSNTQSLRAKIALREGLLTFVSSKGIVAITQETFSLLCAQLRTYSNSTVSYGASSGAGSCSAPPPPTSIEVSMPVELGAAKVTLEAWRTGPG